MGFDKHLRRLRAWVRPYERFVREYTEGLHARDVQRLFHEDSITAYEVLTRDQDHRPESAGGLKLAWHRTKMVFLGLSFKLTPVRRILFAAAALATVLGIVRFNLVQADGGIRLDDAMGWFLIAVALLFFLLVLELADRIRFRDEVEVARQLQHDLLPHQPPTVTGYRFSFSYRTANDIGGDYYDFLELNDGRLGVVAGDASGHGIGAGLLMATAKAALQLAVDVESAPEKVTRLINRVLFRTGGKRAFMTLFFAVLDPSTGQLNYVDAGHPFPLLRRADGSVQELGRGALPLGLRPEVELSPDSTEIRPGDLLLMFSDGLPEAVHHQTGASFGYERLRHMVAAGGSAEEVHARLVMALAEFLGEDPPADDVSVVVVERLID